MSTKTDTLDRLPGSALRGSRYRDIHNSGDVVVQAVLAELPGYLDARTKLATTSRASVREPELRLLVDELAEQLATGVQVEDLDVPASVGVVQVEGAVGTSLVTVENATEVLIARATADAVKQAAATALDDLDAVVRRENATLAAELTRRLGSVIDEARHLAADGTPHDPAVAIATEKVREFQRLQVLAADYVALRGAQVTFAVGGAWGSAAGEHIATAQPGLFAFFVANPLEIYPDLPARLHRAVSSEPQMNGWRSSAPIDWPDSWNSADALRWFVDFPNAEPWAPTEQQLDGLLQRIAEAHSNWDPDRDDHADDHAPNKALTEEAHA